MTEFVYRDVSGEKISVGDRVGVVGGDGDPKWSGRVVEIYPPEPLGVTPKEAALVVIAPTVKILFDDGEEDEFSGWGTGTSAFVFDDLEHL